MKAPLILPVIAVLLAGSGAAARDRNAVPAATSTGPAATCIPLHAIRDSQVRNDQVIDFMRDNRRGWRVTLDQPCPSLGFERAFSYRTPLNQLCAQDIIYVLRQADRLTPGPACGLAPFQPIELIAKPGTKARR